MKPREEREKELRKVLAGPKGTERIKEINKEAVFAGGSAKKVPPHKSGIEAILWLEYDRHKGGE